jgi:hypothetical protein
LLGALLAAGIAAALDPTTKNAARMAVLDRTPIEELIDDHRKNLRAPINEFDEVRIRPYSRWHAAMSSDHEHHAVLVLRHQTLGKYRLGIRSVADVAIAVRELPPVLGAVCRVEVEWSAQTGKYVKRTE